MIVPFTREILEEEKPMLRERILKDVHFLSLF